MNPSYSPSPSSPTRPYRHNGTSKPLAVPQGLRTDEPAVRQALRRMVIRMEQNPEAREDLMQEALLYFWSTERQHPGQQLRWYLQGVKFHLGHLRTSGRSVDSPRHRRARAVFEDSADVRDFWQYALEWDGGIMSEVNAHDLFTLLAERLKPIDRIILGGLFEGLGLSDIAKRINISHQSVIRGRERIAVLAIKLGVVPPPLGQTSTSTRGDSSS